jgi:extradiol dioxygenase family protein
LAIHPSIRFAPRFAEQERLFLYAANLSMYSFISFRDLAVL